MKRKILAALLTLVMVFSLLPVSAWAEETTYSDVAGHWAQTAILRWSDYGVLQGSEGKFSPDGTLTRGQMAVILSRLLNLPAAPSAGFTDVAPTPGMPTASTAAPPPASCRALRARPCRRIPSPGSRPWSCCAVRWASQPRM